MVEMDDGVRLRTWTTGTDTGWPPVVLIHGGPGLWDYLEPVAGLLEPLTVVHRFDQRGCGGSDASDEQTLARYLADIEGLRDHWGHESWSVVGHSFGATLAFAYAVNHPDHTSALGYVSGAGIGDWRGPAQRAAARRMTPEQRTRRVYLESLPDRGREEEVEYRALCWFTDHADREHAWEWAVEDASVDLPINWAANRALMAETRGRTEAELLAGPGGGRDGFDVPCWFVHGDGDPRPVHTVAALVAAVPHARFHVIEGAGHHPWRERPEELRVLLRDLVTGGAATPTAGRARAPGRASPRPAAGRSDRGAG